MLITPNLSIPYIDVNEAQREVVHNEAIRGLDALVQLAVLDRSLSAPPGSPVDGERWLVAASPSGDWAGHADEIAAWQDSAWRFYAPRTGWLAYVVDEGVLLAWNGSAWFDALAMLTTIQNALLFGLGTTADATNPFSAKLNNTLWVAKTVAEGGDGHLRYKLSKESAAKTLSLLMQTNFSGRAEFGLTGDDDFHLKVSADGSAWTEAFVIDRTTGSFAKSPNRRQVDVFTANGSYAVPAWARRLRVVCIGGGAGGGSGAAGDNSASRFGGGGGGAGGVASEEFDVSEVASSLSVVVGGGGNGGTGVTGNTAGNAGAIGSSSAVVSGGNTILTGPGAGGGGAGSTTSGIAGGGGAGNSVSNNGGASSVTGTAAAGASTILGTGSGGGGGGGGLDTSGNQRAGGAGGYGYYVGGAFRATGGSGGAAAGAGSVGAGKGWVRGAGAGGGGGGAGTTSVNGGAGGAGGAPGGGGGGGAATRDSATSGAGGNGARGEVWVVALS